MRKGGSKNTGVDSSSVQITGRYRLDRSVTSAELLATCAGFAHDANNHLLVASAHIELAIRELQAGHPAEALLETALRSITQCSRVNLQTIGLRSIGQRSTSEQTGAQTVIAPKPEALDLSQVIGEILQECRAIIPRSISLQSHLNNDNTLVLCDPTHLRQILLNLILNAYEALPSSGLIQISASCSDLIEISISDDGPGIDAAVAKKLFAPFTSTKSTTANRGLGLSMVKRLIEANCGQIRVDSKLGRGTTFRLTLPRADTAARDQLNAEILALNGITQPLKRSLLPLNILVADDEPGVRQMLYSALTARGYSTTAVPDGESLLNEIARAHRAFDVVILDDGMPGSSAPRLVAKIKALKSNLSVLVTSGDPAAQQDLASDRFLLKPFTLAELYRAIEACAEMWR